MWLLLDRIHEGAELFIGGVFKVAAVGHDVRVPREQVHQIITIGAHLIGCAGRHQRGGHVSGDDEFVAQDIFHAAHVGLVEVADQRFFGHFSQVFQPLVVRAFDEQVAGDTFLVQRHHILFPVRPVELLELRPST